MIVAGNANENRTTVIINARTTESAQRSAIVIEQFIIVRLAHAYC